MKGEDGAPVGAAAEIPQEAPALQDGHGLLADASDLDVAVVAPPLPVPEPTAPEGNSDVPPGALVRLVRPALQSRGGECVDDPALAGSGEVLGGAWQGRGSPQHSAECEDLNVHAAPFVFARVARYFDGDLVDRQQCAVQDDARLGCGDLPLGQGRDAGGQDLNGLTPGRARDLTGRFGMPNSPVPSKRWRADRSRM